MLRRKAMRLALAVATAAVAGAAAPAVSHAQALPPCTQTIDYDTSIPTWQQFWAANPDPDVVMPLGWGLTGSGGGALSRGPQDPPRGRNLSRVIDKYWDGLVAATAHNPRVRLIKKTVGRSASGLRDIQFYVLGKPEYVANLDAPDGDAAFWRGVRSGEIPEEIGLEAIGSRPTFAWITATPHGSEPAAGESITRIVYELLARLDCENAQRLNLMEYFLQPVRNPDGRDAVARTTAWGFDPNRDFGTWNQQENRLFVPQMNNYPGVFFIDAHQTTNGYFFPPNEDPVHHEISQFALDFIQHGIGPALQDAFNAQSIAFRNYSQYDLFTPEYGDTVPALIMGAAGMTYEKGTTEAYAKQVYDHYLAIDTTIKATVTDRVDVTQGWVRQWAEAVGQGSNCRLQENKVVSPLHDTFDPIPDPYPVCGYFFKPDDHTGDLAALLENLQRVGVRIYRFDTPVAVNGYHEFGNGTGEATPTSVDGATLPAGTLWVPMDQGMKHWIQAVLGENPFIPYDYFYDVVTWSYPLQRGLAGSGFLTQKLSPGIQMTEVASPELGTIPPDAWPVYAFNTDSARGLALAIDLLDQGVNVYRGVQPFNAAGKRFYTGAALVDGASLAGSGAGLAALAAARDTPVTGLPGYPVQRRQLSVPKIGLFTNAEKIPSNPLFPEGDNVNGTSRHCANSSGSGGFCQAMHALAVKLGLPLRRIVPVTSKDLEEGRLDETFTAFINPGSPIATTSGAGLSPTGVNLQKYIAEGGIYIGSTYGGNNAGNTSSASAARSIGVTTLDTASIPNLLTPGSTFDATYDTTNPVAWGFDLGGWVYRDASANPVFETGTLGSGDSVVTYRATPYRKYGYEEQAAGLANRPAVADVPYLEGRAVLFGFDPFFRSWKEQDERLVLNAALYPKGAVMAPSPASEATAEPAPRASEIAPATSVTVKRTTTAKRGVKPSKASDRDLKIKVKRADAAKLKVAVKLAKLSKSVKRKVSYTKTATTYTLVVKGVRTSNEHTRKPWVSRLTLALKSLKVKPVSALL